MGLSRLAEKCMECPFVDRCDKKHMEALEYLEMPNLASPYAESVVASTTEPILRETMAVMVDGWFLCLSMMTRQNMQLKH